MFLEAFSDNPYGTNCWLISAEGSPEAVVVDPGFSPAHVRDQLESAGKTAAAVLLTHAHFDHAEHAGAFAGDLPVFIHPDDGIAYSDADAWKAGFDNPLTPVADLRDIADGQILELAGLQLEVLHTPGHTPGHCIFRAQGVEALVFSGDLVFAGAIGRTDFPNSSPGAMRESLARFLTLPDELDVLPGHGPATTVEQERASNPFLLEFARWT